MQNRIVEIATDGIHLSAERGFLKISRQGDIVGKVALDDIAGVVVRGYGATFSANICERLSERNAAIVICGSNQSPSCVIWPVDGHYQQGLNMQAQAVAKLPLLKRLWAELIKAKITNQAFVLEQAGYGADDLRSMIGRVKSGDTENLEAQAARRYWTRLLGNDFKRDRDQDGINAALNYGYTILRAAVARSILAAGLHPSLSVKHQSRGDALRLADDLMEPFRPYVDLTVFNLLQTQHESSDLELSREVKARLVEVLSLDLQGMKGASPLQLCMDRLAQSLSNVFCGTAKNLELPGGPLRISAVLNR
jgi:CRISPR-associated protein Cas1